MNIDVPGESALFAGVQSPLFQQSGGTFKEDGDRLIVSYGGTLSSPPAQAAIITECNGLAWSLESGGEVSYGPPGKFFTRSYLKRYILSGGGTYDEVRNFGFANIGMSEIDAGYVVNPDENMFIASGERVLPTAPGSYGGQVQIGLWYQVSGWFWTQKPNGSGIYGPPPPDPGISDFASQSRTAVCRTRKRFSRHWTGFRATAEVWANDSGHAHGWDDFPNGLVSYYTWENISKVSDLDVAAGAWEECPVPGDTAAGTFAGGFVGMVNFDVAFETFANWETRTGVSTIIPP